MLQTFLTHHLGAGALQAGMVLVLVLCLYFTRTLSLVCYFDRFVSGWLVEVDLTWWNPFCRIWKVASVSLQ